MNGDLNNLNPAQRQAVEAPDGPVMIVAGPGTGKTKTLVARIAWLVETGRAAPDEILALTFTTKAAAEMRERLADLVSGNSGVCVGTFHSVALRILGDDARTFVSEAERLEVIRALSKPLGLAGLSTRELGLRLSRYKNGSDGAGDEALSELARSYDEVLVAQGKRDFDDVLIAWRDRLVSGLEEQRPWRYLLVDEFQDTSQIQYEIIRRLGVKGSLFVIGDPWQSIYGFRGAGVRVFDRFAADFPGHLAVKLEINYRSEAAIVRLANEIRGDDSLTGFRSGPGLVRIIETLTIGSEADFVLGEIEQLIGGTDFARVDSALGEGRYHFRDIAVIYRTHRAAAVLARRLAASGLPYQMAGGDGPYGQAAVRQVVAVVRAICAAELEAPFGINEREAKHLMGTAPADLSPSELVEWVASRLVASNEDDQLALMSLAGALVQFDGAADGRRRAARHLEALEMNEFYDPKAGAITLLTIHAAKGLEFPAVFVLGAHDGGLPHLRADGRHDLDEEQRLFYVAVTRAKEQLHILHARERDGKPVAPSRFLDGLSGERLVDPMMARLSRKRVVSRAKRAQGTLF